MRWLNTSMEFKDPWFEPVTSLEDTGLWNRMWFFFSIGSPIMNSLYHCSCRSLEGVCHGAGGEDDYDNGAPTYFRFQVVQCSFYWTHKWCDIIELDIRFKRRGLAKIRNQEIRTPFYTACKGWRGDFATSRSITTLRLRDRQFWSLNGKFRTVSAMFCRFWLRIPKLWAGSMRLLAK